MNSPQGSGKRFNLFGWIVILGLLSLLFSPLRAQTSWMALYERDEIVALERRLQSGNMRGEPFIRAIFVRDARKSVAMMKEMIKQNPRIESLPAILERLGEYQFSVGLYNTARETFRYLARQYPDTRYGKTAFYYLSRCWQAIGRTDSSQRVLENFLRRYPRSRYSKLLLQELDSSFIPVTENRRSVIYRHQKPVFAVQTGAFSTITNARIQKQFLQEKGFHPLIYQKRVHQKKYYVVCLGEFEEQHQAEIFAREIAEKYRLNYQIIDLRQLMAFRQP